MTSNFQTKRVAPGVNLASGVAANATIGQKFFEKMYGAAEVERFAKKNPEAFNGIMRDMALFMGFSVNTKEPLGESINKKTGVLTVVGNGGEFTMPNAAKIFTPEQLRAENPLVVINPAICQIGKDGVSTSKDFSDEMRQFIQFIANLPAVDDWFVGINGVPKGAPSQRSDEQALYLALWSAFGSFWRGYYFSNVYVGKRGLGVGGRLDDRGGVLVPAGPSKQEIVAAAEKELGGKVGPNTRAAFEALLAQD